MSATRVPVRWSALLGLAVARSRRRAGSLLAVALGRGRRGGGGARGGAADAGRAARRRWSEALSGATRGGALAAADACGAPATARAGRRSTPTWTRRRATGWWRRAGCRGRRGPCSSAGARRSGARPPLVLAGVDGLAGARAARPPGGCRAACDARALRGASRSRARACRRALRALRRAACGSSGAGGSTALPLGPLPPPAGHARRGLDVPGRRRRRAAARGARAGRGPAHVHLDARARPGRRAPVERRPRARTAWRSAEAAFAGIVDDAQVALADRAAARRGGPRARGGGVRADRRGARGDRPARVRGVRRRRAARRRRRGAPPPARDGRPPPPPRARSCWARRPCRRSWA